MKIKQVKYWPVLTRLHFSSLRTSCRSANMITLASMIYTVMLRSTSMAIPAVFPVWRLKWQKLSSKTFATKHFSVITQTKLWNDKVTKKKHVREVDICWFCWVNFLVTKGDVIQLTTSMLSEQYYSRNIHFDIIKYRQETWIFLHDLVLIPGQ